MLTADDAKKILNKGTELYTDKEIDTIMQVLAQIVELEIQFLNLKISDD
jgi:hypothetical protein